MVTGYHDRYDACRFGGGYGLNRPWPRRIDHAHEPQQDQRGLGVVVGPRHLLVSHRQHPHPLGGQLLAHLKDPHPLGLVERPHHTVAHDPIAPGENDLDRALHVRDQLSIDQVDRAHHHPVAGEGPLRDARRSRPDLLGIDPCSLREDEECHLRRVSRVLVLAVRGVKPRVVAEDDRPEQAPERGRFRGVGRAVL